MLRIVLMLLGLLAGLPALEIDAAQLGGTISLSYAPIGKGGPTVYAINTREWVITAVESASPPVVVASKPDEAGCRDLVQRVNAWLSRAKITAGSAAPGKGMYHLRCDTNQGSLMVGVMDVEGSVLAGDMQELFALFAAVHARSR